ncbi:MAG: DUF1282 domain-containing protein [Acidobacteria bacterium]|nr:MAG: DUF1282 domain-containing protein [Acidobacteriota bacterium]
MATATPIETPRAAIWEDFIDIFYAPSAVFRRREHGSVFVPLLVVTVLTGAIFYLNSGALRPLFDAEFDRQMAAAMRTNPNIPPEAVERMRGFASRVGQIGVLVFLPIAMLCVGIVTWVAGKLVDAKESLHTALVVAAYAFTPRVLEGMVNGLQALVLDPAQFNGRFRITFGPGRFLDPDTASPLLIALVGRLDLFTLWITVLIAIGLCVTGRIPLRRAAIAAALVWLAGALPLILQAIRTM